MKKLLLNIALVAALLGTGCTKDLDRLPQNDVTSEVVYATPAGYKQVLAKVYGSMALTGNSGPTGSGDVQGIDEGTSDFLRLFWKAQELSTDEAIVAWNDPGIRDFHNMNWTSGNSMLTGLYNRNIYIISIANEYLRESADDKLSSRGIGGADATSIRASRAEVRFVRALQYWALMDVFGNPPFLEEGRGASAVSPSQISRAQLFTFIETELKAIEAELPAARTNEYGRADRTAAQALLARLYLNAQVYTGTARWADASTYAKRVIDAGYTLIPDYRQLMLADNHTNASEFIFTINYDGIRTKNFGGTTFLTHAAIGDGMNATDFGVNGGWFGLRTTKNLPLLFPDFNGTGDKRAQFFQNNLEINDVSKFTDGFAITKFRNKTKAGVAGSDPAGDFVDIDFPLFRLPEMHLIYAECATRGSGDAALALTYMNALRARAGAAAITAAQLNTNFVLDERARELYWEGHRRTDLIRYNRFTEATYLWPWKGGVKDGTGVAAFRNLYPIPSSDLSANSNLKQNAGY